MCLCLCVCICAPHCLPVQLLVDFDDPTEWVNEKLVVSVTTYDGVKDGSIQLTVNILCYQLQTHTYIDRVSACFNLIGLVTHFDYLSLSYTGLNIRFVNTIKQC